MLAKIQINPTCIVLYNKNSSNNYVLPTKKFGVVKKKKRRLHPQLQPFPVLKQDFKRILFSKKKEAFPFSFIYLLGDLCTCFGGWAIPVSVNDNFWYRMSKLVSSHPPKTPNLQLNKNLFWLTFSSSTNLTMATSMKDTWRYTVVFHSGCKNSIKKSLVN